MKLFFFFQIPHFIGIEIKNFSPQCQQCTAAEPLKFCEDNPFADTELGEY